MPDLSLLTRKVGPLPVVAWAGIGVAGFVIVRALGGGGSDAPVITDGFDPDAISGGGSGVGGSGAVVDGETTPTTTIGQLLGPPTPLPLPAVGPGATYGPPTVDGHSLISTGGIVGRRKVINLSEVPQSTAVGTTTGVPSIGRRIVTALGG